LAGLAKNSVFSYQTELGGVKQNLGGIRWNGAVEERLQRILVDRKAQHLVSFLEHETLPDKIRDKCLQSIQ
jgi:hypothetical protein